MMIRTLVQSAEGKEPQQMIALVIEDALTFRDLITYRNALTMVVKAVLATQELEFVHEECFWLLQLVEFISTSLDDELNKKVKELNKKADPDEED